MFLTSLDDIMKDDFGSVDGEGVKAAAYGVSVIRTRLIYFWRTVDGWRERRGQ